MQKVILLFSGGLDSLLSYYILKRAKFQVKAVQFYIPFLHIKNKVKYLENIEKNYSIKLNLIDISEEYLKILFNPEYGYGDNLNPCVDCKILFLKKAKEIMLKEKYDCVATGEIPGQRPFSQQVSFMNLIEKKSGVRGFILRPLAISTSKVNFDFDKSMFYDLKGRSRKPQLKIAKEFNINPIPSPAGGCLLTDSGYCNKIKLLKEVMTENLIKPIHFEIIKHGRVFTINNQFLLIIGRNKEENNFLKDYSKKVDCRFISFDFPSPSILILPDKDIFSIKKEIENILKRFVKKEFHHKIKNF